jgi:hypothetical protein
MLGTVGTCTGGRGGSGTGVVGTVTGRSGTVTVGTVTIGSGSLGVVVVGGGGVDSTTEVGELAVFGFGSGAGGAVCEPLPPSLAAAASAVTVVPRSG